MGGPPVRSVRSRLLLLALLPMLVAAPLLLAITMTRWSAKMDQMLAAKVASDLTVAQGYLERLLAHTGREISALSESARFRDEIGRAPEALLEESRARLGLDFLYLADSGGRILAVSPAGAAPPLAFPVVAAAREGRAGAGIDVFGPQDLAAVSPALAARAVVPLVETPAAAPTARKIEDRGLMIQAAAPAELPDGRSGFLAGGALLNRNLDFIDRINDLVYREGASPEGGQGTATLFLEDVRVSTNVRLFEGERALGTRVSQRVRDHVLGEGRIWLDSAFVVNDWYVSAYEPILDGRGERAGMLYVGFLEAPFAEARRTTALLVGAVFLLTAAVAVPFFLRWARGVFKPLEIMTGAIAKVEAGDLGARTGLKPEGDEIARVAGHLDHLLDQVQERDAELRALNADLNRQVDDRTKDLRHANLALEAASRQLVLSEKLAAIGEITAGVAHEINNPIAVIQGNLEVLRQIMGEGAKEADFEFRLVEEQIRRINALVNKLLRFARPEEFESGETLTDPARVAEEIRPLVRHLLDKGRVVLETRLNSTAQILMNPHELQQVLVNLIVNAVQAMPEGGRLLLESEDAPSPEGAPGLLLRLTDEGHGMDEATLARIFDPFFTTRGEGGGGLGGGTGLGLSICRKLIDRQGGRISAESAPGEGSRFEIWLPQAL